MSQSYFESWRVKWNSKEEKRVPRNLTQSKVSSKLNSYFSSQFSICIWQKAIISFRVNRLTSRIKSLVQLLFLVQVFKSFPTFFWLQLICCWDSLKCHHLTGHCLELSLCFLVFGAPRTAQLTLTCTSRLDWPPRQTCSSVVDRSPPQQVKTSSSR